MEQNIFLSAQMGSVSEVLDVKVMILLFNAAHLFSRSVLLGTDSADLSGKRKENGLFLIGKSALCLSGLNTNRMT